MNPTRTCLRQVLSTVFTAGMLAACGSEPALQPFDIGATEIGGTDADADGTGADVRIDADDDAISDAADIDGVDGETTDAPDTSDDARDADADDASELDTGEDADAGPVCGDGELDEDEECDDGNTAAGDGCGADCLVERPEGCGDGIVDAEEECDDGNAVHDDDCSNLCRRPFCGDRIRQAAYGEECDDGNVVNDDGCTNRCRLPACGDGIRQGTEPCDDGEGNSDTEPDACRPGCVLPRCGDGVADSGEACDDGNTIQNDGCTTRCTLPACGDGIVHPGEECDRGAANSDTAPDACRADCTNARCGDGVRDAGEGCDDGNRIDDDACSNTCVPARCGDGRVNGDEACDDGNTVSGDCCDARCRPEVRPECDPCLGACGPDELCVDAACECACPGGCEGGRCFVLTRTAGATAGTFTFGSGIPQADLAIDLDVTGSMATMRTALSTAARDTIFPTLSALFERPGFGLATFADFPCGGFGAAGDLPFRLLQRVTTDASAVHTALGAVVVAGGADQAESGYEALFQIATGSGVTGCGVTVPPFDHTVNRIAGVADGTIGGMGFRAGSLPIVLHVTDAPAHEASDYAAMGSFAASSTSAIEALGRIGARVISLSGSTAAWRPQLVALATQTGATVPVCAWGETRPASCSATQCCTGNAGAGRPAVDGMCPLVLDLPTVLFDPVPTAAAVGAALSNGLNVLAATAKHDVDVEVSALGSPDGVCMVRALGIASVSAEGGVCPSTPTLEDTDTDGRNDRILGLAPGSTVAFDLELDPRCVAASGTYALRIALVAETGIIAGEATIEVLVR